MSLSTNLHFTQYQIDKAEARLAYQMTVIDRMEPLADSANADLCQRVFDLLEQRLTTLYERQDGLLVELEHQTEKCVAGFGDV